MSGISERVRRHQVIAFFVLAFAGSWLIWIPVALFVAERGDFHPLFFIGGFGPLFAAVLVTRIAGGRAGLRRWLRRSFRWRVGIGWYLLAAVILPLAIALVQFGLYSALGGQADFSETRPWWVYLVNLPIVMLFAGGNEEPGWRGFALPKMLTSMSPFTASLVIGVLWALWHVPLEFRTGWEGQSYSFAWFTLNTTVLSFIMTWLYLRSGGSVLPVMLFHQASNQIWDYFPMNSDVVSGPDDWLVLKTMVYGGLAIVLLVATRGRLGQERTEAAVEAPPGTVRQPAVGP